MTDLRTAAQQALEALKNNAGEMRVEGAISILETALAQQAEPAEDVLLSAAGLALDALEHDRQAAARSCRSISMLSSRAIEELRGAFRAALAQEQVKPLTIERLRDALVASRIIPPAAVEDPDEYDDGVTLYRIEALHGRLT